MSQDELSAAPPEDVRGEQTPLEPARPPFEGPPVTAPPSTGLVPRTASAAAATDEDRRIAGVMWIAMAIILVPVVSLVVLVADGNKGRPFQRYHAINSIVFWVAAVIYETIAGMAFYMLAAVTFGIVMICFPLYLIFFLPFLLALYYAWQAYQGREIEIPFVSQFARSQRWI